MYIWVQRYIGIPFISNGRTKNGCDCYGLVRLVLNEVYDILLPELSNEYTNARVITETAKLFKEKIPVLGVKRIRAAEEKALIVMRNEGQPCHLGIAAGNGCILHTNYKTGSVCQRESHPALRGRIEGYYRVR